MLLNTRPTGILLTGSHQAQNCLIDEELPEIHMFSCALFLIREAQSCLCQRSACMMLARRVARLKWRLPWKTIVARAQHVPFIVLADTDQNLSKSLLRVSRFKKLLSFTTVPPQARKHAWERFLLFLVAEHPKFQFPTDAHESLATKSPGFDLSDFVEAIKTFFESSSHNTTTKHNCFSFDVLWDFVTSH